MSYVAHNYNIIIVEFFLIFIHFKLTCQDWFSILVDFNDCFISIFSHFMEDIWHLATKILVLKPSSDRGQKVFIPLKFRNIYRLCSAMLSHIRKQHLSELLNENRFISRANTFSNRQISWLFLVTKRFLWGHEFMLSDFQLTHFNKWMFFSIHRRASLSYQAFFSW